MQVNSRRLLEIVTEEVFIKMLYDLRSSLPEMRHIAYLTVLTSLTTKATESTLANHLFALILEDERHSSTL